jgi:hypothetical protein
MRGKISLWWAAAERFFLGFCFFSNAKNDANISKYIFWGVFIVFCYFLFFLKIYHKNGSKIG